jgi:hypothetical protein
MNLLIVGLLFVVALLAVGGAIWLALGERQVSRNAPAHVEASATARQVPTASTTDRQRGPGERTAATSTPTPAPVEPGGLVTAPAPTHPAAHGEQPFSALNGQFYELGTELRALHREAQDIERRLGVLTEMVSRIEREYGEVSLEAE